MPERSLRAPLALIALGMLLAIVVATRPAEGPSARAQGYSVSTTTVPATAAAAATATPTPTTASAATAVPTAAVPTPVLQSQPAPTAPPPPTPTRAIATPTPTVPAATAFPDAVTCSPGQPVTVSGLAPPRSPLLVYFGERPVGGGMSGPDGSFAIVLQIGSEEAGAYPVVVRVRGSWSEVGRTTCVVPVLTATPQAPR